MKIALVTPGIAPYVMGGMQRHSYNLALHLARLGVEIDLYHTDFSAGQSLEPFECFTGEEASRIHSIPVPWPAMKRLPGHYIRELKQFSNDVHRLYLKRQPVDFIIAKSLTAWSMVEAKRRGAPFPPIGVNIHGFEMFQPAANWSTYFQNFIMRKPFSSHVRNADYVFSYGGRISTLIRENLGIPSEKVLEIPGAIDPEWITNQPAPVQGIRRFIFLGRHERRKGIEELHQVIRSNPQWGQQASFRFVGPIPAERQLKLPHVTYAGALSSHGDLQCELRNADVLLCPSHSEGMPNSILEGMASGLAVIATDVGAVRFLVGEHNGILLPECCLTGITRAIEDLIQAPSAQLDRLKVESHQHVRNFTWDAVALKTLRAIEICVTLGETK
jgi:glycosyltransferase involved in cell wall biosynthesis